MLGVLAIIVVSEENFLLAALLITLGSILDVLDGQLAVRFNATSDIGKQLDSLADVVTFGVAPTIMLYHLLLIVGVTMPIAVLASLSFVLAGAYRLARFNTMPSNRLAYFKGMPIPMACILLITGSFWQHWVVNVWWSVVILTVSYLMVSAFPYPKINHLTSSPPFLWVALIIAVIVCWVVAGWQAVPFGVMVIYAISGPALLIYRATRLRLNKQG